MDKGIIIAAVRSDEEMMRAVESSVDTIFMLAPNITTLTSHIAMAHKNGKKIFIHIDLAEGIGKDEYGIRYAKAKGIDGIISTRNNLIKLSKKMDIFTVQRFFIMDSHSVETTLDSVKTSKPDMIEIMPATVTKVIKRLKDELDMPIVAGGLIETKEEIKDAVLSGASMVSTGKKEFWN